MQLRISLFAALVAFLPLSAWADDRDAYSATPVPPNIMFLLDDSGSMMDLSCEDLSEDCFNIGSTDMRKVAEPPTLPGVVMCRSASIDVQGYDGTVPYAFPDTDFPIPGASGYPSSNMTNFAPASVYRHGWSEDTTSINAWCSTSKYPNCEQRSRCIYGLTHYGYFFEDSPCIGEGDPMAMCGPIPAGDNACAVGVGVKTAVGTACTAATTCGCNICSGNKCQECSSNSNCGGGTTCQTDAAGLKRCVTNSSTAEMTGNFLNFYPPKYISARRVLKNVALNTGTPSALHERMGLEVYNSNSVGGSLKQSLGAPSSPQGPVCSKMCTDGSCDANYLAARNAMVTTVNGLSFSTSTPLGETLDDIACYYSNHGGPTCSGNGIPGSRVTPPADASPVCLECQRNFAIFITDGFPNLDGTSAFNTGTGTTGHEPVTLSYYANEAAAVADDPEHYLLPDVSKQMFAHDLDLITPGTQNVISYAISYGASDPSNPSVCAGVLARAAANGGGQCFLAKNASELSDALVKILADIDVRSRSFTGPSLQSSRASGDNAADLATFRADPNGPLWEGHFFGLELWDESLKGDFPGGNPAIHNEIFVLDATGGIVVFDSEGDLLSQPFWDAGLCLAGDVANTQPALTPQDIHNLDVSTCYKSGDETQANARQIFTSVSGAVGTADPFTMANEAALHPLLGLGASVGPCTSALPSLACVGNKVIGFFRGLDMLDRKGRGTVNPVLDRNLSNLGQTSGWWKLGDMFHSIPAMVSAPSELLTTPLSPNNGAYASFAHTWGTRARMAIAGANDGFIHAFQTGTASIVGSTTVYDHGNGTELWAFAPPHLLPKMASMLSCPSDLNSPCTVADKYEYFADGSAQVRDAYVPRNGVLATTTTLAAAGNATNWMTMAMVGDRDGGKKYTALDVTNPTAPKFLWEFPSALQIGPGTGQRAEPAGLSWSDAYPDPAPIMPVEFKDASGTAYLRWVVLVNGGFSRTQVAGRGIYMVDAYDGTILWKMEFKSGASDDRQYMFYSFAAPPTFVAPSTQKAGVVAGAVQYIVAVDTGGQVWQVDLQPATPQFAGAGTLANWVPKRIFATAATSATSSAYGAVPNGSNLLDITHYPYRGMYAIAAAAWGDTGDLWVMVGTGDRDLLSNPTSPTTTGVTLDSNVIKEACGQAPYTTATYVNRLYGLDATALSALSTTGTESNLTNVTGALGQVIKPTVTNPGGWFLELKAGEKVNNPADVFVGAAYFTTFTPPANCGTVTTSSTISCSAPTGVGTLYVLNYQTGLPIINLTNTESGTIFGTYSGKNGIGSGVLSSADASMTLGAGVPSAPNVSFSQQGKSQSGALVVSTSANSSPVAISAKTDDTVGTMLYDLVVPRSLHDTLVQYGTAH